MVSTGSGDLLSGDLLKLRNRQGLDLDGFAEEGIFAGTFIDHPDEPSPSMSVLKPNPAISLIRTFLSIGLTR